MPSYKILNAMSPESFLNPELFRTDFDSLAVNQVRKEEKYQEGFNHSLEADYIFISANGVWGAALKNGSLLTSSEGIGYHSNTESLLRGFLDGPAPIKVYRLTNDGITCTIIKEQTNA